MGASFNQIPSNNRRVCCDRQKHINCSMHERLNEIKLPLVQMSKAAEAFINQKFSDVFRNTDGASHQSKHFLEVLEILNSNKELFMKLLQDPNSLLMKHIQNLRDYQAMKDKKRLLSKSKSLEYWFTMETPWKESVCTQKRTMQNYLWKKIKFLDKYPLNRSGNPQTSNIVENPKPVPAIMQIFENRTRHCSSLKSNYSLVNEDHSFRPASLSFTNIKRKLKRAIGSSRKEQLWTSTVNYMHKFSYDCLGSKDGGNRIGGEIAGRNSSIKAYSGVGRTVISPIVVKRTDNIYRTNESELSKRLEVASISERDKNTKLSTVGFGKQRESSIYVKAKQHLSEMLSDEVWDMGCSRKQVSRTLEKKLSSPEHYSSPLFSTGRGQNHGNHGFVTAQMRFSPCTYMDNENIWQIQEENKNSFPNPVRLNAESPPSDDKNLNNRSQITDLKPLSIEDVFPDSRMSVCPSSVKGYLKIIETSNSVPLKQNYSLEVPSESIYIPTSSANLCTDTAKRCKENGFSEGLRLDTPLENQQRTSSFVVSSSSPISIYKIEDIDGIKEKVELPSPVSVLEPFTEDVTSPADSISQSAHPPIQPLQINFEEQCSFGLVIAPSDPKINSSIRMDSQASASDQVRSLLQASSLNWDELIKNGRCPHQLIDLDNIGVLTIQSSAEHKLLCDCINEVFLDVYQQHFETSPWVSYLRLSNPRFPMKNFMVHEVINGVDRHLLPQQTVRLEQLIVKDMEKSRTWVDIRIDIEDFANEMVEGIVQELAEETIVELQL